MLAWNTGPAGHAETLHARSTPSTGLRWLFGRGTDSTVADPETSSSKKRKMNAQGKSGSSKHQKQRIHAHKKLKRNGSELFDRPAGEDSDCARLLSIHCCHWARTHLTCQNVSHQMADLRYASHTCLVAGAKQFARWNIRQSNVCLAWASEPFPLQFTYC